MTTASSALPSMTGRTAVVTGSTSGIGAATARTLAAAGARVVVTGRDARRGADVVASCDGDALFLPSDLARPASEVRTFAQLCLSELGGRVDVLVNNAAVCPAVATTALTDDELDDALAVNVRSPHVLVAALVPGMLERQQGAIVTIGSWMASTGTSIAGLYGATKAAEEQLTRSWAAEFGQHGVRVNTVSPGVIRTPVDGAAPDVRDVMTASTPGARPGLPEDIARAVLWLVGDGSGFVHGATVRVDGGIGSTHAFPPM